MFSKTLFCKTLLKITAASDYPDSYYFRTVAPQLLIDRPSLRQNAEADVCVIGGGLAGVNTALGLAERGKKVILLETKRIGYGASGRNGGMALPGFSSGEEDALIDYLGPAKARELYNWTLQAQALIKKRVTDYKIPCDFIHKPYLEIGRHASETFEDITEYCEKLNKALGSNLQAWTKEKVRTIFKSNKYFNGILDLDSYSVHPLNLTLGLAHIAELKGVNIYEHTTAINYKPNSTTIPSLQNNAGKEKDEERTSSLSLEAGKRNEEKTTRKRWIIETTYTDLETGQIHKGGSILANHIVLAGSAYSNEVDSKIQSSLVPVYSYIMVTEPLTKEQYDSAFGSEEAMDYVICDDAIELDYYRLLPDRRLLWGTFARILNPISSDQLPQKLKDSLLNIYPSLKDVKVNASWGGAMCFTPYCFPYIGHKQEYGQDGIWFCTGFGGHGVVATTAGAELVASAIASDGQDNRYQIFQGAYPIKWIGGPFRYYAAELYKLVLVAGEQYKFWKEKDDSK